MFGIYLIISSPNILKMLVNFESQILLNIILLYSDSYLFFIIKIYCYFQRLNILIFVSYIYLNILIYELEYFSVKEISLII